MVAVVLAWPLSRWFGTSFWRAVATTLVIAFILWVGWLTLRLLAREPLPPPDPGEMRKVKLTYECLVCGTEVRMTAAPTEDPEPPRHCLEDMVLRTPID